MSNPDDRQRIPTIGLVVPDAVPREYRDGPIVSTASTGAGTIAPCACDLVARGFDTMCAAHPPPHVCDLMMRGGAMTCVHDVCPHRGAIEGERPGRPAVPPIVPRIPTLDEHRRAVALSPTATIMLNDAVEVLAGTIGGDPSNFTWTLGPDRGKPGRMRLIVVASFDAKGLNAFAEAMKGRR